MRIAGLFVGVDEHADRSMPALRFAGRDALVLWSIFADLNESLGHTDADIIPLVGRAATRAAVLEGLERLADRSNTERFDFVHIHFSCHGLRTGSIVLADTVIDDHATALPLAEVTSRIARIKGVTIVVTCDFCFAATIQGMAGSENATGFQAALSPLAGETRTVAWASNENQEALESARFQHGLFTAGLVLGLRTYAIDGDRIVLTRWIQYAVDFAQRESLATGRPQTPGAIVRLAPDARIPVPTPGPRQLRVSETFGVPAVTADPGSLAVYGFDDATITAIRARIGGHDLNQMQIDAVSPGGVLAGRNVVVRAPTSAGKTLIGELAVLRALQQRKRAIVLLPTRALVREQYAEFAAAFSHVGCEVARSCGDVADDDDAIRTSNFQVAFPTYEKFAGLAFARPQILEGLGVIVVDEVHLIGDRNRGRVVELILARALLRRRAGQPLQIVALCGPVDEMNGLEAWLEAHLIVERARPIPLIEGVLAPSGRFRHRHSETQDTGERRLIGFPISMDNLPLAGWQRHQRIRERMAVALMKGDACLETVLVFRSTRPGARRLAKECAVSLGRQSCESGIALVMPGEHGHEDSRAGKELRECLKGGTAFHTRDLRRHEREAVERLFRDGSVTALVATTGLAMGVNTPASAVIVADHDRYDPVVGTGVPIDVVEYRNMAGRAGRLGRTTAPVGVSYLLAETEQRAEVLWETYFGGSSVSLKSGLEGLAIEDLVLTTLALADPAREADVLRALLGTFHGHQRRNDGEWASDIRTRFRETIEQLLHAGFIVRSQDGKLTLSPQGRICAWDGLRYASAYRLILAVQELLKSGDQLDQMTLLVLAQITDELDDQYTPVRDEIQSYVTRAPEWFVNRPALLRVLRIAGGGNFVEDKQLAERIKRVLMLRRWVDGSPLADIEAAYEHSEPATKNLQDAVERTGDLLRAVGGIAATVAPDRWASIASEIEALGACLEYGVSRAARELSELGLGLSRHEVAQLAKAGIENEASLRRAVGADDPRLAPILTTQGAQRLKAAVGKRAPVSTRKSRKAAREAALLDLFPEGSAF